MDDWVTVSEQEIADAVVSLLHHHSKLVEGATGVALAAFIRMKAELVGKRVVIVCCGGNISVPTLRHMLDIGRVQQGQT